MKTLSDKIGKDRGIFNDVDVLKVSDVKEFIKDFKVKIDDWMRDLGIFESAEKVNIPDVLDLVKELDNLAGAKLLNSVNATDSAVGSKNG